MVRLAVALLLCSLVLGAPLPASAADEPPPPAPTVTTLAAPSGHAGDVVELDVLVATDAAVPVVGAVVEVQRQVAGVWQSLATVATDDAGQASVPVTLRRRAADNLFRAAYAGDAAYSPSQSAEVRARLLRWASEVRLAGPGSVVDERSLTLRVRWLTSSGLPVPGVVRFYRRYPGRDFVHAGTVRTDASGRASFSATPRLDTAWYARGLGQDWVVGDASRAIRVDNLPPGVPVDLPAAAPAPRIALPPQPRATRPGAAPVVTRIPDGIWSQMTGASWHRGCPVGRGDLRLLRINYWDYAGYRRRGELVAHERAVGRMAAALTEMYDRKLPIRAMYRIDRFGWSSRLRGGNDYASMAAGNTSAFNCRDVVNRPGRRSPHSWGFSLDVNTWENPYRSATGLVPNAWWMYRSHPRVAWRSHDHAVVRVMARHGLRWTYGNGDTQHFDAAR